MYSGPISKSEAEAKKAFNAYRLISICIAGLDRYLTEGLKHPVPQHANPTDHALDLTNTDFYQDHKAGQRHVDELAASWLEHESKFNADIKNTTEKEYDFDAVEPYLRKQSFGRQGFIRNALQTWILMERNMINYSRNLLAYGVRLGMYSECSSWLCFSVSNNTVIVGMGVLLATVWVNLAQTADKIVRLYLFLTACDILILIRTTL